MHVVASLFAWALAPVAHCIVVGSTRRGFIGQSLSLTGAGVATAAGGAFEVGSYPLAAKAAERRDEVSGRSVPADKRDRPRGPPGVNQPELLPKGPVVPVLDLEKWMPASQAARIERKIAKLEGDSGVKLRVLTQAYPRSPGLAIKDYWNVDDKTVVMICDRGAALGKQGNKRPPDIINFNVGQSLELQLPRVFLSRLRAVVGGPEFVGAQGEGNAVEAAVNAIVDSIREGGLVEVPDYITDLAKQKATYASASAS